MTKPLAELAATLARDGRYSEAEEVARSIEDDRSRTDALAELAAALTRTGEEDRAKSFFDEAEEVARSIEDDRADALMGLAATLTEVGRYGEAKETARSIKDDFCRVVAFGTLAATLARDGRYGEAKETARSIRSIAEDWEWADTLRGLVTALAEVGRYGEAEEVARSIEHDQIQAEACAELAAALARAGRFNYALTVVGSRKLDEFLQILAQWAPSFDQLRGGLSVTVLCEATNVAGWLSPDWRKIHRVLSTSVG